MNSQLASILPPTLKPNLKRPLSPSFRENTRQPLQYDNYRDRANSLHKRSRGDNRHIQWDKSMPDMTASGRRVHRTDARRDTKPIDIFHRDRHDQRPQRPWDVKPTDVSHRGQHAQWPRTQQNFQMTSVPHNQGKGHPFQRDARMPSHNQGRGQHGQHDARMIFHNQDRRQHTQRDALSTSHSQRRNQHAQRDTRIAFHDQGSAHRALPDCRTIDSAISNAIRCKDPPGPTEKLRCKPLLTQIYADIHAASLPGAIQATADLAQLTLLESRDFSTQNWFRCNAALQTRAMFRVIEYAFAGQELCNNGWLANHIYAAANSVCLPPEYGLGRAGLVAKAELRLASRHANLAQNHGFMMLSILATSAAYREAARSLDDATWDSFGMCIGANFSSLEYFAKIRGLDWLTALKRIPQFQHMQPYIKQRFPGLQADHPHTYIVPTHNEPLQRPTYKGQNQVPIQSSQYLATSFGRYEKPQSWASNRSYPSDPTIITNALCDLCKKYQCTCDPTSCIAVVKPLVEITNYGAKGNGIHVLQPIKKGDTLEEYIGEIKHIRDMDHNVYGYSLDFEGNTSSAYIDAQFLGNWTRFINHSCEASAKFELKVIGQRIRVMVVAIKDVDMFDELTIDYGSFFWFHHKTLCKCGSPLCVSQNTTAGPMDICEEPSPGPRNASRARGKWEGQHPPRPYYNFYR